MPTRSQGLVDVLDRILDKGLVVAGDIRVNLANVELLTIQVRLLVCSIDKAEQIGLTWWKRDAFMVGDSTGAAPAIEQEQMRRDLRRLQARVDELSAREPAKETPRSRPRRGGKGGRGGG